MRLNVLNVICNATEEADAIDYATNMVWNDGDATMQDIAYAQHIVDLENSIGVWYDYGADYYFFVDNDPFADRDDVYTDAADLYKESV